MLSGLFENSNESCSYRNSSVTTEANLSLLMPHSSLAIAMSMFQMGSASTFCDCNVAIPQCE